MDNGLLTGILGSHLLKKNSHATRMSSTALSRIERQLAYAMDSSLASGFAGLIFSEFFSRFSSRQRDQWLRALTPVANRSPELLFGNAGLLLSAIQARKYDLPSQARVEARLVNAILAEIKSSSHGLYWNILPHVPLQGVEQDSRKLKQHEITVRAILNSVDLGFAHGLAGLVFVLARYSIETNERSKKNLKKNAINKTIHGLCQYLLRMNRASGNQLSSRYAIDHAPYSSSPHAFVGGWCSGDPGLSVAFLWASRALNSKNLETEAWRLFHRWNECSRRQRRLNSSFCHGMAGYAEISRFFFSATNRVEAWSAWHYWCERLLKSQSKSRRAKDQSLLTGLLGIEATLRTYRDDDKDSDWSAMLGTGGCRDRKP